MKAMERLGDEAFIQAMSKVISEAPNENDESVNLAAERQNQVISMEEFAGNFN